jgi:hypothetical protein
MNGTQQQHTIILVQKSKTSKLYEEFPSVPKAIDCMPSPSSYLDVISLYESRLKELNPTVANINYTVKVDASCE